MRLPSLALFGFAVLATAAASIACGAPPASETEVSEGEVTGQVRKGDEFARCWTVSDGNTTEFFRTYALTCRVSSKGLPGLAGTSVFVDAHGASGRVVTGRPGETPDQDVVLGTVSKSDFPLRLHVYGTWAKERTSSTSAFRIDVPAPESANGSAPVVIKLPFDIWPVTVLNRLPLAIVSSGLYDVQAAPFFTERDESSTKTTFTTSASSGIVREPRFSLDLIAPPSDAIDVQIEGPRTPIRASIAAPGVYVLDEAGLRLATPEEEAEAGAAPAPATEAGASDGGAPQPDAAPAATCGDPGQMHCTAPGGTWSCNTGTRVDADSGLCLACGNDGQTYCVIDPRNISGSWQCNAGTRLEPSTNKCVACGTVGKTHCVADPRNISGNWTCNAGLRLDTSSGLCLM